MNPESPSSHLEELQQMFETEQYIRRVVQLEIQKALRDINPTHQLEGELMDSKTVKMVCKLCHDNKKNVNLHGYCHDCQQHIDDRDKLMKEFEIKKKRI